MQKNCSPCRAGKTQDALCIGVEGRLGSSELPTELSSGGRPLLLMACAAAHQASQNFLDRLALSVFLRRRNHLSTLLSGRSHCLAKLSSSPWKRGENAGFRPSLEGQMWQYGHLV